MRRQTEDPGVEHLSDEELLKLTPRRPAAFEQIYIRHERLILAYFRRRTRSAAAWRTGRAAGSERNDSSSTTRSSSASTGSPRDRVEELLKALPHDQAEAIRARILDEQSYDVIAARLRCSALVARKRVSRGLATLRDVLEER